MLKDLVRERLIKAADEIFQLFENTIVSYEEQLYQAREENERQRQLGAVCKIQTVLCAEGVQQTDPRDQEALPPKSQWGSLSWDKHPQPYCIKEEDQQPLCIKEEVADVTPAGFSEQSKEGEELSQLYPQIPSGGPQPDLIAPSSNNVDTDCPWNGNEDWEGHENSSLPKRQKHLTCSYCGKRFGRRPDLLAHKKIHAKERRFTCSVCGTAFLKKPSLETHMRNHTGEKPFKCSSCGKTFTRKDCLVRHMRLHTGEQPFVCSYCGRTFAYKPTMIRHMRKHTGENPFKCTTCGKAFSQKSILNSHMKTHIQEKPFCCAFCGESYTQRLGLTAHVCTHNK